MTTTTASDQTFAALAEPNRRRIVELLAAQGELGAGDIAREFDVTSSAVSQHLRVLREAELLLMTKRAQRRLYRLNPRALEELEDWFRRMKETWAVRFDQLDSLLKDETEDR